MPGERICVLKFGGSVIADESSLGAVRKAIEAQRVAGYGVVAVVSALHGRTDTLAARCGDLGSSVHGKHAAAAILAIGESESAALLGAELAANDDEAVVATPAALDLVGEGDPLDAMPVGLDDARLASLVRRHGVVIVPGFAAIDGGGRPMVLGRGGSDLTALFVAHRLDAASCVLIKDVDGLYDRDPSGCDGAMACRYTEASFADALATDGSIVQHKAVRFAREHGVRFELGSIDSPHRTRIGPHASRIAEPEVRLIPA